MCGIWGWQWGPKPPPDEVREHLALLLGAMNDQRGGDSWGWYDPNEDDLVKGMGLVAGEALFTADSLSLIGHTRFATVGAKVVENAHPFDMGRIVGAHNGSVSNHFELDRKHSRSFDCDSMHLFQHLEENKSFKDMEGYGAIHWVNRQKPGRIYLARLNQRGQLSAFDTEFGTVWSSDKDHLELACAGAGIGKTEAWEVVPEKIHYVQGGKLFTTKQTLALNDGPRLFMTARGAHGRFTSTDRDDDRDDNWWDGYTRGGPTTTSKRTLCTEANCYSALSPDSQMYCPRHRICWFGACRAKVATPDRNFCEAHASNEKPKAVEAPTSVDVPVSDLSDDDDMESVINDLALRLNMTEPELARAIAYAEDDMTVCGRCANCEDLVVDGFCETMAGEDCEGYSDISGVMPDGEALETCMKIARAKTPTRDTGTEG